MNANMVKCYAMKEQSCCMVAQPVVREIAKGIVVPAAQIAATTLAFLVIQNKRSIKKTVSWVIERHYLIKH